MTSTDPKQIKRIIVRGTNWVGDAMMTLPALRELRRLFPEAHITLATRSWANGLFKDAEFVDEFQIHDGRGLRSFFQQVRAWRKGQFDLAVLFTNSFESALVASLARIPVRIGYAADGRARLLTHPIDLPEWRSTKHEIFYYLKIIAGIEWIFTRQQTFLDVQPDASLEVSDARKDEARYLLRRQGVTEDGPVIALCPGSINSRAKRWPAESYAVLADRCIDTLNAQILLVGSKDELEVSKQVSNRMHNKPIVLTGQTDLSEVVAVLSIADLLITNDTGPAHIASALGRPTLVIFGPTNPLTTRPFSPFAEIIRHPPDCAPCMLRDCPIDHRCMTAITPDEVFSHARALLSNKIQPDACEHSQSLVAGNDKLKSIGQVK
ncbi:MAG TPA: lipopolysaccharide heptosyltransferase II [Blastocatellia bacterium]|nr:lipopolysaccharide heptosyltransferase II [Blastocatellia bacterium]